MSFLPISLFFASPPPTTPTHSWGRDKGGGAYLSPKSMRR